MLNTAGRVYGLIVAPLLADGPDSLPSLEYSGPRACMYTQASRSRTHRQRAKPRSDEEEYGVGKTKTKPSLVPRAVLEDPRTRILCCPVSGSLTPSPWPEVEMSFEPSENLSGRLLSLGVNGCWSRSLGCFLSGCSGGGVITVGEGG